MCCKSTIEAESMGSLPYIDPVVVGILPCHSAGLTGSTVTLSSASQVIN